MSKNITPDINTKFTDFENNNNYDYFGINEVKDIHNNLNKEKIRKEFYRRIKQY